MERTNSFTHKSFLDGILSLNRRLRIFLLVSFQLICAALFLVTSYVTQSFQSFSAQLCKINSASLINQLDLRNSLSFNQFGSTIRQLDLRTSLSLQHLGSTDSRSQLQNKFQTEQLVQQQLPATPALATQLQQQQPQTKELDDNKLDENNNLESNQLQRNKLEAKKQNKQLQEQQLTAIQLRQLHLHQLHDPEQPFPTTKQLSKKPCFPTTSFSKQELERLHLTRSSFRQDDHQEQLEHPQSAQLLAEHLADHSFHRNNQQQQLVQQSFYTKMNKKHLPAFQSQLRPEQPKPAYSRLSLQQLTPSNLLESFQLPSSASLLAILVVIIFVDYDKSFQLSLQQLCLSKAQGGELPTAFPPACCTTLRLPALTLMSLSFAVAWLKPFSLSSRRRRALRTLASKQPAMTRRRAWRQRSSSTIASMSTPLTRRAAWKRTTFTTRASRRTTSSNQACRITTLQTSALRRTSSSTSSSTPSTSAFTTRTRSLISTTLLSIFFISFSFKHGHSQQQLVPQ